MFLHGSCLANDVMAGSASGLAESEYHSEGVPRKHVAVDVDPNWLITCVGEFPVVSKLGWSQMLRVSNCSAGFPTCVIAVAIRVRWMRG